MTALELDKKFDDNKEDILEHFDISSMRKVNQKLKRINIDCPSWMINSLDKEAQHIGVSRQAMIKMWLVEKLERTIIS